MVTRGPVVGGGQQAGELLKTLPPKHAWQATAINTRGQVLYGALLSCASVEELQISFQNVDVQQIAGSPILVSYFKFLGGNILFDLAPSLLIA